MVYLNNQSKGSWQYRLKKSQLQRHNLKQNSTFHSTFDSDSLHQSSLS
jgi:VCBS repeat-containing protein